MIVTNERFCGGGACQFFVYNVLADQMKCTLFDVKLKNELNNAERRISRCAKCSRIK